MSVVKSHLQSLLKTQKQQLIEDANYEALKAAVRLSCAERLASVSADTVARRLREIQSKSTRTAAKAIFATYLGINGRLERAIIDENGSRLEGNSFVKAWLTADLAPILFANLRDVLSEATAPTVLACCLQLGTGLRMTSVRSLSCSAIDELLAGQQVTVLIRKTMTSSIKQCLAAFLTTDPAKSMVLVDGTPVIEMTRAARALIVCEPNDTPCAQVSLAIFKQCIPHQQQVFGIRNEGVEFTYGAGFHEIRRFAISWVRVALANHPQRDQLVAKFADHSAPGKSSTARYTQNSIVSSELFNL